MPTTTTKRQRSRRTPLSDAERATRQQAQRERLEQAVDALQDSQGWQRWLTTRAAFRSYSLSNQILIAFQRDDATRVAGFRAWQQLGYQVRKGERSIRILAPRLVAEHDTDINERTGHKRCIGFLDVSVFDVSQCEPREDAEPLPLGPPSEPITGATHAHLLDPLRTFARGLGYEVEYQDMSQRHEGGWCDHCAKLIVVDSSQPVNAQVRIVVHELAHALGVTYKEYGRLRAEVIVDATTYCVLDALGLDVSGESVPYIAGYGNTLTTSCLREHAELIDTLAKHIEDACTGGSVREPEEVAS